MTTVMKMRKNMKGFSLVELIIVIGVLAILAVSAIMIIGNVRENARNAADKANAQSIVRAVNTYNSLVDATDRVDPLTMNSAQLAALELTAEQAGGSEMNLGVSISDTELTSAKTLIEAIGNGQYKLKDAGP